MVPVLHPVLRYFAKRLNSVVITTYIFTTQTRSALFTPILPLTTDVTRRGTTALIVILSSTKIGAVTEVYPHLPTRVFSAPNTRPASLLHTLHPTKINPLYPRQRGQSKKHPYPTSQRVNHTTDTSPPPLRKTHERTLDTKEPILDKHPGYKTNCTSRSTDRHPDRKRRSKIERTL